MKNDQTKKKILALIMSMTIAAGLAGCAPKNANVPINAADAAIVNDVVKLNNDSYYTENKSQSKLSEKEMKTYLPPEDGWTWEKLSQTIYIDGINYESFNTYRDIKGKYTFYDVEPYIYEDNTAVTMYNDTSLMYVNFKCEEDEEITDDTLIKSMLFCRDDEYPNNNENAIVINGIKIGATRDELVRKMGEPTKRKINENNETKFYKYVSDCGYYIYFYMSDDCVKIITIIFEE